MEAERLRILFEFNEYASQCRRISMKKAYKCLCFELANYCHLEDVMESVKKVKVLLKGGELNKIFKQSFV